MPLMSNFLSVLLVAVCGITNIEGQSGLAIVNPWINGSLKLLFESLQVHDVSSPCSVALTWLVDGIRNNHELALKMIDASGKMPTNIYRDSASSIGLYDQCLNIKNDNNNITGHYCSLVFQELSNATSESLSSGNSTSQKGQEVTRSRFQWDICLPDACTKENLTDFLSSQMVNDVEWRVKNCVAKKNVELNASKIVAISFFSLLAAFLLFGSLLELALCILAKFKAKTSDSKERGKIVKVFLSFSLYGNAKKILNTNKPAGTLDAVHGMRFLSMSWIILGQTYSFVNMSLVTNYSAVKKYEEDLAFQVFLRSSAAADTFFFLSGLVIVYSTMRNLKIEGGINWAMLYLHRFIRLTPAYGFVILFSFLMPLMGSGPYWDQNWQTVTHNCEQNWWSALLYVNNFVRTDELCLHQSWFLSNVMQFFLITPLIMVFLWKIPVVGILLNTLFLAATFITPALLMMGKDAPNVPLIDSGMENIGKYMTEIYMKPYSRIGPYCIGIYIGYLLCCHSKFKIPKVVRAVLWCLAIACNLAVIYGPYQWKKGHFSSKEVNAFYAASHGTGFALGLAWITYSCCTGHGGLVNKILAWRAFVPLSRVTYMAFLVHPFVIYAFNWSLRDRFTVSHYFLVLLYLGFLMVTYGVSFLASIALEAPFIGVEKALRESVDNRMEKVNESELEDEEMPVVDVSELPKSLYEQLEEPSRVNVAFVDNEAKTNF